MERRSPLVLPPDSKRCPNPAPPEHATPDQTWPQDRDAQKVADAEDSKRKQDEYLPRRQLEGEGRSRTRWRRRPMAAGPLQCGSILLQVMTKRLMGTKE